MRTSSGTAAVISAWPEPGHSQTTGHYNGHHTSSPEHHQQLHNGGVLLSTSSFHSTELPMSPTKQSMQFVEPVDEEEHSTSDKTAWEYRTVNLSRVPGFGFGIAVSGGRDNPHFKSGDPSIVVSDVVRGGPASGLLQINDRILSANGVGMENADYNTAVQIMKESEALNLVVKRRVPMPAVEYEQRTLKFTLSKSKKKGDFGIVLGCKFYIKDITNKKLAEKEPGLKEGDVVLKVNGDDCCDLTLGEARKLLDKSRDKLSLVIQRDVSRGTAWRWPSQQTLYERLETPSICSHLQSPRTSPMLVHRGVTPTDNCSLQSNASNRARMSGRYGRLSTSEYYSSPQPTKRHSYGSQPSSRSRTPNPYPPPHPSQMHSSAYDSAGTSYTPTHSPYVPVSHYGTLPSRRSRQSPYSPPSLTNGGGPPPLHSLTENRNIYGSPSTTPIAHKPPLPTSLPEPRYIKFAKGHSGSVGIRVIGGNEHGIFVSAVQAVSPAAEQGVRQGDKILSVNSRDMKGATREEAVLFLLGLQDNVELIVQYRKDEFDRVRNLNLGDNFYVRVHFDYNVDKKPDELSFCRGDIFQITDTLHNGIVGSWQAVKVSSPQNAVSDPQHPPVESVKGVIPNATRAEQIMYSSGSRSAQIERTSRFGTLGRKIRSQSGVNPAGQPGASRRARSLTKGEPEADDSWPGGSGVDSGISSIRLPAYERVVLRTPNFRRPVVLYGSLADIAMERLLQDFPLLFTSANENGMEAVRLSGIKEIMSHSKHPLLDITPSSVERLQFAQYAPIVVYLHVENRARLRDLRRVHSRRDAKNTRKLMEHAARMHKQFGYLFSAVLDATHEDRWFEALRELINHLQERRVWMSESRLPDVNDDEFLFQSMATDQRFANYVDSSEIEQLQRPVEMAVQRPSVGSSAQSTDSEVTSITTGAKPDNRGMPPPIPPKPVTPAASETSDLPTPVAAEQPSFTITREEMAMRFTSVKQGRAPPPPAPGRSYSNEATADRSTPRYGLLDRGTPPTTNGDHRTAHHIQSDHRSSPHHSELRSTPVEHRLTKRPVVESQPSSHYDRSNSQTSQQGEQPRAGSRHYASTEPCYDVKQVLARNSYQAPPPVTIHQNTQSGPAIVPASPRSFRQAQPPTASQSSVPRSFVPSSRIPRHPSDSSSHSEGPKTSTSVTASVVPNGSAKSMARDRETDLIGPVTPTKTKKPAVPKREARMTEDGYSVTVAPPLIEKGRNTDDSSQGSLDRIGRRSELTGSAFELYKKAAAAEVSESSDAVNNNNNNNNNNKAKEVLADIQGKLAGDKQEEAASVYVPPTDGGTAPSGAKRQNNMIFKVPNSPPTSFPVLVSRTNSTND